jgi:hypothetical protein
VHDSSALAALGHGSLKRGVGTFEWGHPASLFSELFNAPSQTCPILESAQKRTPTHCEYGFVHSQLDLWVASALSLRLVSFMGQIGDDPAGCTLSAPTQRGWVGRGGLELSDSSASHISDLTGPRVGDFPLSVKGSLAVANLCFG